MTVTLFGCILLFLLAMLHFWAAWKMMRGCQQAPAVDDPDEESENNVRIPLADIAQLLALKPLYVGILSWERPEGIDTFTVPWPERGIVVVCMRYREVDCSVPIGCACCVHSKLDDVACSLIEQADPDPCQDALQRASEDFEAAIQEMQL